MVESSRNSAVLECASYNIVELVSSGHGVTFVSALARAHSEKKDKTWGALLFFKNPVHP